MPTSKIETISRLAASYGQDPIAENHLRLVGPGHDVVGKPVWGQKTFRPNYSQALQKKPIDPVHYTIGTLRALKQEAVAQIKDSVSGVQDLFTHTANVYLEKARRGELLGLVHPGALPHNAAAVARDAFVKPTFDIARIFFENPVEIMQIAGDSAHATTQRYVQDLQRENHTEKSSTAVGEATVSVVVGAIGFSNPMKLLREIAERKRLQEIEAMREKIAQNAYPATPHSIADGIDVERVRPLEMPGKTMDVLTYQPGFSVFVEHGKNPVDLSNFLWPGSNLHGFDAFNLHSSKTLNLQNPIEASDPLLQRLAGDSHQMTLGLLEKLRRDSAMPDHIYIHLTPSRTPPLSPSNSKIDSLLQPVSKEIAFNLPAVKAMREAGYVFDETHGSAITRHPRDPWDLILLKRK